MSSSNSNNIKKTFNPNRRRRRFTGISIDKEADQRTIDEEEIFDHSKKLKGLETLSAAAQFKLDIKMHIKPTKMTSSFNNVPKAQRSQLKTSLVMMMKSLRNPDEVTEKPDEVTKNMNEVTEKDDVVIVKPGVVTENADNVTMADEVQPAEQQVRNKEHGPNIEPASDTQADVQMFPTQPEKPEATIISSSHTLSSIEFTNQFLNEHVDVNLSEI
ncbi:hypothetical protein Tco_0115849 [Tanacetum coccineum]